VAERVRPSLPFSCSLSQENLLSAHRVRTQVKDVTLIGEVSSFPIGGDTSPQKEIKMDIKHWIETREKIESKPSKLEVIVEIISGILIGLSVMASMWFFLVATANY